MVIAKVNEEESAKKLWFAVVFFFYNGEEASPITAQWLLVGWLVETPLSKSILILNTTYPLILKGFEYGCEYLFIK